MWYLYLTHLARVYYTQPLGRRICITLTSNCEALILWVTLQKEPVKRICSHRMLAEAELYYYAAARAPKPNSASTDSPGGALYLFGF